MEQCALHAVAASLARESGALTVFVRMLVLTCLLETPFVLIVSLDFCRSVPVLRPPAAFPRADSGTATKPLTWMVSSARLHEVLETKASSSLVAESDQLHAVLERTAVSSLVVETDQVPWMCLHWRLRLIGCTSCWRVRLPLHLPLRLTSCTRSRRAVVHVSVGILVVTLLGVAELVACA